MDPMTLWFIVGGIFLAAFVIVGFVAVSRRAALRRAEEPSSSARADAAGGSGDDAGAVDVLDRRPVGSARHRGRRDAELDVAGRRRPRARAPEATETRLARLRRRLAGSNSALSRGLLMLLSRDRIDEETWEDFEDTLITVRPGGRPDHRAGRRRCGPGSASRASPIRARPGPSCGRSCSKLVDPTMDRTLRHRPDRAPRR